ncbi:hypothetical protein HN51_064357 [Arachis hypogaea]|uniref:Transmembrane protein n=1 Tax=Arachis hypogaea TaxID=3818 RepID=A0A445AUP5_ARAHY|nr:uncharacterized protein LOC107643003 [Arachis ipaensis]XP_025630843.1 uncharacterized protein LOC112723626 [Arachis hypogaea]QHO21995.1 hypothetical protein DS421_11g351400 [Arachis hypogaea]RYR30165.1 hypothetical protein Ahy_B01g054993 [Arachis hypogaea]
MSEQQPQEVTTLLMRRCKVVWRLLLLFNFALGAYIFAGVQLRELKENRRRKSHRLHKGRASSEVPKDPITASVDWNYDDLLVPATTPVAARNPLLEEQQREVLLWMLQEKRKMKPKDRAEKKQIDEEKAILKRFLRAKSIPKF